MRSHAGAEVIGALLLGTGVLITETQLYPVYANDSSLLLNVNFVVGVIIAGCAVVSVVLLLTGHRVGGGASAIILGALLTLILLRSGNPAYYAPPFLEVAGGLFPVLAHESTRDAPGRAALPPQ